MVHTRCGEKAFQCFHGDREAECEQKDTIDESGKDLGSVPPVGVTGIVCTLAGELRVGHELRRNATSDDEP